MNEKYIKHTVQNLIEFARDLVYVDATEVEYTQAIEALKTAEIMLDFYDNELYELLEQVDDLKIEIGSAMFDLMVDTCREKVYELTGIKLSQLI